MAYISQADKKELAPAIKKVLHKYGMKGTISIDNHSTLVVTLTSGCFDLIGDANAYRKAIAERRGEPFYAFEDNYDVNPYYASEQVVNPVIGKFFEELIVAMKGNKWFDKSDSMTDYFHTAYYINVRVGRWNKPYVFNDESAAMAA